MLKRLDHVNLRTANLASMTAWYESVLAMRLGARPSFPMGGAWLYVGDDPVVHLVEVEVQPTARDPALEHFAIAAAERLDVFLDHLDEHGVPYRCGVVPDIGVIQVNIHDPDGNHIHIDFAADQHSALVDRGLA